LTTFFIFIFSIKDILIEILKEKFLFIDFYQLISILYQVLIFHPPTLFNYKKTAFTKEKTGKLICECTHFRILTPLKILNEYKNAKMYFNL
jgi:hypothetical protein